ncbi:MAG: GNAT family N-acetyltransferase [Rhodobacteraceae bacterium]|nr:GNAT family N-acetyltransferase [Paracoccaceae bacterium]
MTQSNPSFRDDTTGQSLPGPVFDTGLTAMFAHARSHIAEDYVRQLSKTAQTPDGQYLFNASVEDLIRRRARVAVIYAESRDGPVLIAGRHSYFDASGRLRLRGAFVAPNWWGRSLGPALLSLVLRDWQHLGRPVRAASTSIIVQRGVANPASTAALAKLGFEPKGEDFATAIRGTHRDGHLLPFAESHNGQPVVWRRRMHLRPDAVSRAISFFDRWRAEQYRPERAWPVSRSVPRGAEANAPLAARKGASHA